MNKKIKLSYSEIKALAETLANPAASGEQVLVEQYDDDGKLRSIERGKFRPWALTLDAYLAFSKTGDRLRGPYRIFMEETAKMIRRHTVSDQFPDGDTQIGEGHPGYRAFRAEYDKLCATMERVDVFTVSAEKLYMPTALPEDRIPMHIMSVLGLMVEDSVERDSSAITV